LTIFYFQMGITVNPFLMIPDTINNRKKQYLKDRF